MREELQFSYFGDFVFLVKCKWKSVDDSWGLHLNSESYYWMHYQSGFYLSGLYLPKLEGPVKFAPFLRQFLMEFSIKSSVLCF